MFMRGQRTWRSAQTSTVPMNSSGTCGPDIMSFLLLHPEVYDARDHTSPILQELPVILRRNPCAALAGSLRAGQGDRRIRLWCSAASVGVADPSQAQDDTHAGRWPGV